MDSLLAESTVMAKYTAALDSARLGIMRLMSRSGGLGFVLTVVEKTFVGFKEISIFEMGLIYYYHSLDCGSL